MGLLLMVALAAGVAAAQQKCDEGQLAELEAQLPSKPEKVARGLLDACPSPLPVLRAYLSEVGKPSSVAADRILLDARSAYMEGRYEDAILIARTAADPASVIEEWLQDAGLPSERAFALAKAVAPAPPRADVLRLIGRRSPRRPSPTPSPTAAAVQQKCDERKMAKWAAKFPVMRVEIARGLLDACPAPPLALRAYLDRVGLSDREAADRMVAEARSAYVNERYQESMLRLRIERDPVSAIERWLCDGGLRLGRAHWLATTIVAHSPKEGTQGRAFDQYLRSRGIRLDDVYAVDPHCGDLY